MIEVSPSMVIRTEVCRASTDRQCQTKSDPVHNPLLSKPNNDFICLLVNVCYYQFHLGWLLLRVQLIDTIGVDPEVTW